MKKSIYEKKIETTRVTMKDVADAAGVSRALVSRVLRGDESLAIKQHTRQKIIEASESLRYRPNALARALRLKRSGMVGLLIPNVANPFFNLIIQGVSDVMQKNDLMCIVCNTSESPQMCMRYMQLLDDRQVDGLVLATATIDDDSVRYAHKCGIKFVYATRYSDCVEAPYVVMDTYGGITQATKHLIELGHKKIAHITGNLQTITGHIAISAFRDEMERNGLPVVEDYIVPSDYMEINGYNAMCSLLSLKNRPTAVVACTDLVAIYAIKAVRDKDLRVPEDISITGYNNVWSTAMIDPPLTTIDGPMYSMGSIAACLLIELLNGHTPDETKNVLDTNLIVRESTMKYQ
jgi:DNA-binding LacI/PurR family transcriptional regulator